MCRPPFPTPRRPVSPRDGPRTAAGGSCNRQSAGVDPGQPGAATVGRGSYNRPRRGLQLADGATTGKRGCADGHGLRRGVTFLFLSQRRDFMRPVIFFAGIGGVLDP